VVYFVLAIVILIALVYGLLLPLSMYCAREPVSWWQPELLRIAAPGVGLVVGGASAFKVAQFAPGGQALALIMGGEEVCPLCVWAATGVESWVFDECVSVSECGQAFGATRVRCAC
jgi:hypothetical protein